MPKICVAINRPSNGCRNFATSLGLKRVRPERVGLLRYRVAINWGTTSSFDPSVRVINNPAAVLRASDKLVALRVLMGAGVPVPPFSESVAEASQWSRPLLARTRNGHGGKGIVVVRDGEEIPAAQLYTWYIKKQAEYRVHCAFGQAIFVQQKRKRNDLQQTRDQKLIRNSDNGWVFVTNSIVFDNTSREDVERLGIQAVESLGLDFGAVDIILSNEGNLYVLEVNTAPGLESSSGLAAYERAFLHLR